MGEIGNAPLLGYFSSECIFFLFPVFYYLSFVDTLKIFSKTSKLGLHLQGCSPKNTNDQNVIFCFLFFDRAIVLTKSSRSFLRIFFRMSLISFNIYFVNISHLRNAWNSMRELFSHNHAEYPHFPRDLIGCPLLFHVLHSAVWLFFFANPKLQSPPRLFAFLCVLYSQICQLFFLYFLSSLIHYSDISPRRHFTHVLASVFIGVCVVGSCSFKKSQKF